MSMKKILMVDDVATNLICAVEVLRTSYEVSTAKSGRQALLMLNEMTPDLIMLDVNMPVMDGYEVFQKLQTNPEWADIPVVFLTAETDMNKEIKGLSMGAMDYIRKPFDPEVMKTRIDKILSLTDRRKELESQANFDTLTSLPTRKALETYLTNGADSAKGYFLLLDLDNFKAVNDNYGHVVGDAVLQKLAKVFIDIVGQKDRICRLGGDEFAMFLPASLSRDDVKSLVRRMIATCEFEISDTLAEFNDFKVSVSAGISLKPSDGEDFQTLYNNADKALYYVKQNGKRGYHFFDSMNRKREDFDDENTRIDLMQLQRLISEHDEKDGAYKVEYEGFKRIYRFVARCMDRKDQDVQIVLFTLSNKDKSIFTEDNEYVVKLGDAVANSLRRGDVATQCGDCQYVVILMDANEDNGKKVAGRIMSKYEKAVPDSGITLSYEMQTVKAGANLG